MKELAKIAAYFFATILIGALLAPALFWLVHVVGDSTGIALLQEATFQKVFNRALLITAIALLWPVAKWLRVGSWRDLGLDPDPLWRRHLLVGFGIAAIVVAAMALAYISSEVYRWKRDALRWGALPKVALSASAVAFLEEALFRGAILGLFRRSMRAMPALFWTSAIFSILHFLKPDESVELAQIGWLSGFTLIPHLFHQFAQPLLLLGGFTTIFVLGWILGFATIRTRSLWMAIGFHAGVVFVKMGFSKFSKRREEYLPWIGEELQIGLVPVFCLTAAGLLVWAWLHYVDRSPSSPRS